MLDERAQFFDSVVIFPTVNMKIVLSVPVRVRVSNRKIFVEERLQLNASSLKKKKQDVKKRGRREFVVVKTGLSQKAPVPWILNAFGPEENANAKFTR